MFYSRLSSTVVLNFSRCFLIVIHVRRMHLRIGFSIICLGFLQVVTAKDSECEVCVAVLNRLRESLGNDEVTNAAKVEEKFKRDCEQVKQQQEHRFCYYVGGLKESATSILGEMIKPFSWGMPSDKVCEKLRKKDNQICDLKYEKALDWKTLDIHKLKVKDLKKILGDWGEDCKGCTEKSEFIKKIEELKPKFVKEEL